MLPCCGKDWRPVTKGRFRGIKYFKINTEAQRHRGRTPCLCASVFIFSLTMRLLFIAFLFAIPLLPYAQPVFAKTYDGGKFHEPPVMATLSNGNVSIANSIDDRATVAMFNPAGGQVWAKKYSSGAYDTYITGLTATSDGHLAAAYYAFITTTQSFSGIFKIDALNGNVLWNQKLVNDTIIPYCWKIQANPDGYLVDGFTSMAPTIAQAYGLVAHFDHNGGLSWANSQILHRYLLEPCKDQAGNIYAIGRYFFAKEAPFVKYAPDGKILWNKHLELDSFDLPYLYKVMPLPDQDLLLSGSWDDPTAKRALLMKTDTDANIRWTKAYALSGQALVIYDTHILPDGNILAVCHGAESPALITKEKSVLLKISPDDGTVIWAKQYDEFGKPDLLDEITPHLQGGYWLSGRSRLTGSTNQLLLFRTDSEFGIGTCCPREVTVTATEIFPVFTQQPIVPPRSFKTAPVNFTVTDVQLPSATQCAPIPLEFAFADSVLCPGECTVITIDTVLADVMYSFDLDGGTTDPNVPNSACFPGNRTYSITLKAEKAGCLEEQNAQDLLVRSIADQFANAFTPNGDGVNDIYRPLYHCPVVVTDFKIYNRWGKLVYETKDPAQGWNGMLDGQPAPADVYAWLVEYEAIREEGRQRFSEKGDVTLLR